MQAITTIGLDIAKSVFQVHGVDAEGKVVVRRQLKRRYVLAFFQKLPPCLVGIKPAPRRILVRDSGARPQGSADATGLREAYVKRRRTMPPMQKPSARLLACQTCGSLKTKTAEQQSCLTRDNY